MSLLLVARIAQDCAIPDFGEAFAAHIAKKTHPEGRSASLTAWKLLAQGLRKMGIEKLPQVAFSPSGKPYFPGNDFHFSLSHSGNLTAALISSKPCGVDVQLEQPEIAVRLRQRCLSEAEMQLDFFECWAKKECIGKLEGAGIGGHPAQIDTLDERWKDKFFCTRIRDEGGQEYALAALCEDAAELKFDPENS